MGKLKNMNKLTLWILFTTSIALVGCAVTPDFVRRNNPNRESVVISAKRPLVKTCISQQLKKTAESWSYSSYRVIESEESVLFMSGEMTIRIYDLEDSVEGTIVTFYSSSIFASKARSVIDYCRDQFESQKPHI